MSQLNPAHIMVFFDGDRRFISCQCGGARYHAFLDEDFKPQDDVLYKKTSTAKGVTQLSTQSSFGKALLSQVLQYAKSNDLFGKAVRDHEASTRKRQLAALNKRKHDAATALFSLLVAVKDSDELVWNGAHGLRAEIIKQIDSILAPSEATGREVELG